MSKTKLDIKKKLRILNRGKRIGNVRESYHYFGISRAIFYRWRDDYEQFGEEGFLNKKPSPKSLTLRMRFEIEEKILYFRKTYHLRPNPKTWYLNRYHDITFSESRVYRSLKYYGFNRLLQNVKRWTVQTLSYKKQSQQLLSYFEDIDLSEKLNGRELVYYL
jgi:hypothetical protein